MILVNPGDFLAQAKHLAANCQTGKPLTASGLPVDVRTSISRAYYAAHLIARQTLFSIGFSLPSTGKCHAEVPDALTNSGNRDLMNVASKLKTLCTNRRKADYDITDSVVEDVQMADDMCVMSDAIIAKLRFVIAKSSEDMAYKDMMVKVISNWISQHPEVGIRPKK